MRYVLLCTLATLACSSSFGKTPEGSTDARRADYQRDIPETRSGSVTIPSCKGVDADGECRAGKAVRCQVTGKRKGIRTLDCPSLNKKCVMKVNVGASCEELEVDKSVGGGSKSPCKDTGISEKGYCSADGEAVFCGKKGASAVTKLWDCKKEGKSCEIGNEKGCSDGAFCCGESAKKAECGDVTYEGTCTNQGVATWCDDKKGLMELDCPKRGQRCKEGSNSCADGAYCCGSNEVSPCGEIPKEGKCDTEGGHFLYCDVDEGEQTAIIRKKDCEGTTTCLIGACGFGAKCCETGAKPQENACTKLGFEGDCKDSKTIEYCLGTKNSEIKEMACKSGEFCVKKGDFAECVASTGLCPGLGNDGQCTSSTHLQFCDDNTLVDWPCDEGKTCSKIDGFSKCR